MELGEGASGALERELQEELGVGLAHTEFIGACENAYAQDGDKHQEVNLVFAVELSKEPGASREAHIRFEWVRLEELAGRRMLPEKLKQAVLNWAQDKKCFWADLPAPIPLATTTDRLQEGIF